MKNTGKSFSVTANLQRVFSLLKAHNPALCTICSKRKAGPASHSGTCHKRDPSRGRPVHVLDPDHRHGPAGSSKGKSKVHKRGEYQQDVSEDWNGHEGTELGIQLSETQSLKQALAVLEQEFGDLKIQYHSLVSEYEKVAESITSKTISEAAGSKTLKFIGDELKLVIQNMETKVDAFIFSKAFIRFQ